MPRCLWRSIKTVFSLIVILCFSLSLLLAADTTVKYTYDGAGRLVRVEYGNGVTITYAYDPAGNLLRRQVSLQAAALYFPFYQADATTFVGFAVSNFSDQIANLKFTSFDPAGAPSSFPQNPALFSLDPETQLAKLGSEIFGVSSSTPQAGWVELSSDSAEIGSFFQFGTLALTQMDGSVAFNQQGKELCFPRVFEGVTEFRGQSATTQLSIANPNDDAITVQLKLFGTQAQQATRLGIEPSQQLLGETTKNIAGKGFLFQSIPELFGETSVSGGYVEAEVTQGEGAVGFEVIQLLAHGTVIGLNASFGNMMNDSYSAQLASSPGIYTNLNVINTSDQSRALEITAVGEEGTNLADAVSVTLAAGEQLEQDVGELFDFSAAAAAAPFAGPANSTVVGSLRIEADGPGTIGDVIFGDPVAFTYAASMPLQTQKFLKAVFSQVANTLGFFTGLAFYNPNLESADVTIQVFSSDGVKTGEETITIGAGRRISKLVPELVPSTAGQVRGYIVVQSTQPLIAQQLFGQSGLNLLSAVPPKVAQ